MAEEITLSRLISNKIDEVKGSFSNQLDTLPTPTEDSKLTDKLDADKALSGAACALSDTWTSDAFSPEMINARTIIIENMNKIIVKAKELVDKAIYVVPNQVLATLINKLLDLIKDFAVSVVEPVDDVLIEVSHTYNNIIRKWRELKKINKDIREGLKSEDYKKAKMQDIVNQISALDENIAMIISLIFTIDGITELLDGVKSMFKTKKGTWEKIVNKFKDLHSLFSDLSKKFKNNTSISTILKLVTVLLPIIASIAAALLCSAATDAKIRKAAKGVRDEELKSNGIDPSDIDGEEEQKKLEQLYSNLSELLEYALKDLNGYSLKFTKEGDIIDASTDTSTNSETIVVSVCPPENLSDSLEDTYTAAERPIRYILELGKDLVGAKFVVDYGSSISNDQTIGYYQGIPIKSTISGVVIERKNRYIIVESRTTADNAEDECQSVIDNLDLTDRFSPIVDKFKKINYIETYITDFALPCRFPNLVLHSSGNGSYAINILDLLKGKVKNSKYRLIDDYNEAVDDVTNKYKNTIKNICSSANVKTSCENYQNDKLGDKIFDAKKQGIKDIISFYKSWIPSTRHYCSDEDKTYMLVTDYINYLSDTTFDYNDDNPYTVELFNDINNFIKNRMRVEQISKDTLIKEFNSKCYDLLKAKLKTSNYYSYFSKLFKDDWYVQSDSSILGVSSYNKKADESYDSLYTKMYNYILNLINAKNLARDNKSFNTDEITDINAFLSSNSSGSEFDNDEKDTIKKQNKAKAITKYYMIIRNMSYNGNSSYSSSVKLKDITRNEARILDELTDRVIAEYNKPEFINFYDNINSMFDEFKKVNCPYQGILYVNNYEHEHYVYSSIEDTQMNPYNMNATADELNDRLSAKTKHSTFTLPYWLIYCAEATLVNVLVPLYWSTGLNIAGAPILLPIIYLPIYFLSGSVSVLFGLGICGIAIWPMMVFINNTAYSSTSLLPITLAIDFIKKKLRELGSSSIKLLTVASKPLVSTCDAEIYQIEDSLKKINIQIATQKNTMAGVDFSKVTNTEIPELTSTSSTATSIGNIFNGILKKMNSNTSSASNSISQIESNSSLDETETIEDDGLYHNVIVYLNPSSGKKANEKQSPFTANKEYPSGWEKNKTSDESILKFNEYSWSLEICRKIKSNLQSRGIKTYIISNGSSTAELDKKMKTLYNYYKSSNKHQILVSIACDMSNNPDMQWKTGEDGWSIYTSKRNDNITYYSDSVALAELIYDNAIIKFRSNDMNLLTNLGGYWKPEKAEYYKKYNIRHREDDYTALDNLCDGKQMMPAVLSKNFYCDNVNDIKYMNSSSGKTDIAIVHINGILQFISAKGWA